VITAGLLARALLVLAALFALAVAVLFGHGAWLHLARRGAAARLDRGRAALRTLLDAPLPARADLDALRALRTRLLVRLVVELGPSLSGERRTRLVGVARELGLLATAERSCRSRFWWRRLRGVRLLSAIGAGEDAVPPLLDDPHPLVRADAAEWAGAHPGPELAGLLLQRLADPSGLARFSVQDSLIRMGPAASEPLRRFLETGSGPGLAPALQVAAGVADARFLPAARWRCTHGHPAVRARAAELVGAAGGAVGVDALTRLLDDPEAAVRVAAVRSLGAMGHWPAGPAVARLLRDPAWEVRRAAGLALRGLGGPGQLLLRRALADADPFAADMARQVLDLPGGAGGAP
jgi:hypothetical protein